MKRLAPVLLVLLVSVLSCAGLSRDTRIGRKYALVDPDKIMINTAPSLKSGALSLEEPEAFVIEGSACADDMAVKDCIAELMVSVRFKDAAGSAFYLVRFESGRKGYINARHFYPTLSYALASEERADRFGLDPAGLALRLRNERKALKAEFERFEQERIRLIDDSAWSREVKGLLLERRLFLGMDRDQAMLSLARAGRLPQIIRMETEKGEVEKWVLGEGVYYFRRGALVRWKTPAGETGEKDDK